MKKILSIVLAVCMLAGLCVGISLSGSAAVTQPTRPTDAVNYAVDASSTPVANFGTTESSWDATSQTLTFKVGSGTELGYNFGVPTDVLEGEYVVKFQVKAEGSYGGGMYDVILSDNFKFSVTKLGFLKDGVTLKGNMWDWIVSGYPGAIYLYFHVIPEEGKTTKTVQVYLDAGSWTDDSWEFTGVDMTNARVEVKVSQEEFSVWNDPTNESAGKQTATIPTNGATIAMPNVDIWLIAGAPTTTTTTTTTTAGSGESTTAGETTTTTKKQTGVVDGVDLDKKGTGKDVTILAPAEAAGKNLADPKKATLSDNGKVTVASDGTVTIGSSGRIEYDLSGIKASDDYVIKFTLATALSWPHSKSYVIFGTNEDGTVTQSAMIRGNITHDGMRYEFPWVFSGTTGSVDMRVPTDNTTVETEYTIYVTTSPETGLRRIFFFANGKLFQVQVADGTDAYKTTGDVEIEGEKCLTPCLIFKNDYVDYATVLKNVQAYVAEKATYQEPKVDKTYTTPPLPNANAKNYADLSKATTKGNGAVDAAAGKLLTGSGADGSVTVPLTGLKKTDSYVVSFMTTMCSYDAWQQIGVVVAQDGDKVIKFTARGTSAGNSSYSSYIDPDLKDQRLTAVAAPGDMTKIDILVTNSVETGKRRVVIFQDGKVVQTYVNPTVFDNKNVEALTPVLVFNGGSNYSSEVTSLKVFKLSDSKGYTSNGDTGNASTAVAALAVTAAVALPVIFVAKKKRKEEE